MQLTISYEQDPKLKRLLGQAVAQLETAPYLLRALPDGTLEMACPLPAGYKPAMNPWATELRARISAQGWLFEISERSPGISGGWGASCIPPPLFRVFLTAWLKHVSVSPLPIGQLELFAV